MAKVEKISKGWPTGNEVLPASGLNGKLRCYTRPFEIENGDSADSTILLGVFPRTMLLHHGSIIYHEPIAGVTGLKIGTKETPDALKGGIDISSGAYKGLVSSADALNSLQPLWQRLGMVKDPFEDIELYLTLNAEATASGKGVVIIQGITE